MTPAMRAILLGRLPLARQIANWFKSSKGAMWDGTDKTKLDQSSTGGTAVTASADPVGYMPDLGGRGFHMLQATAGARPAYTEENGLSFVRLNGSSQFMKATAVDLAGCTTATVVLAIAQKSITTSAVALEGGNPTNPGGVGVYVNNALNGAVGGGFGSSAGNYLFNNGPAAPAAGRFVVTLVCDPSGASADAKVRIRIDGRDVDETQPGTAGTVTTAAFAARDWFLGARAGTGSWAEIDFFRGLVIGATLTDRQMEMAELWCAQGAQTLTPNSYALTQFTDTGAATDRGLYLETSAYSSADFETEATVIEVASYNNLFGTYPTYTKLGVLVDGVYSQSLTPGAAGSAYNRAYLPAGTKTVSIVNGTQSKPSGTVLGVFATQVSGNSSLRQTNLTPLNRVLVYGDSIAVGDAASPMHSTAWAMMVRAAHYPNSLALEAWGYRSLHDDCVDATARTAFVAKVAAYSPETIWLAIGTNDYGLNKWAAAAFGTAFAALLDDLHTALPDAAIYAQTPILRTTETANASGSTLGDYRTQIATAQSTRSAYCTLVDGTAFMTTASLADGVHPTTAGHALYADAVKTALGIA
jgi:lysophospholipase L1-like esterase